MGYYWLNHRSEDEASYSNVEGEVYHYRSNVPGSNELSEGDRFVYYRPGEYVIFGAGEIDEIKVGEETEESVNIAVANIQPKVPQKLTNYYAHISNYREFNPPIRVREIKQQISFLKNKKGLRGVPQVSIYGISKDDFRTILDVADEELFLSQ